MDDSIKLERLQLDALREVANIGAGHAATALSQMTGRRIMISVPQIEVARISDVPDILGVTQGEVAAVFMKMLGDLTGKTVLVFDTRNSRFLCDMLMQRELGTTTEMDALVESSLKETGNIVGAAYMNALAEFMGMMLLPSVPSLKIADTSAVLAPGSFEFGDADDIVISVQTQFEFVGFDEAMEGYYLVFPDVASLKAILEAIRMS